MSGSEVIPKAAHRRPWCLPTNQGARVSAPPPWSPQGASAYLSGQQCAHQEGSQRVSCQPPTNPK